MTDQLNNSCSTCGIKKCEDGFGVEIECLDCSGSGGDNGNCESCGGAGFEKLEKCPVKYVDEIREFLRYYRFYKSGFLPESGPVLDQVNIFNEACLFLDSEIAKIENKKIEDMKHGNKRT